MMSIGLIVSCQNYRKQQLVKCPQYPQPPFHRRISTVVPGTSFITNSEKMTNYCLGVLFHVRYKNWGTVFLCVTICAQELYFSFWAVFTNFAWSWLQEKHKGCCTKGSLPSWSFERPNRVLCIFLKSIDCSFTVLPGFLEDLPINPKDRSSGSCDESLGLGK